MYILDRYLFAYFLRSFAMIFLLFVGLYIAIDLSANFDELGEDSSGLREFVERVGKYYALHSLEYFARLAPVIMQAAAMWTLAELKRHNEIVPLLAAGVPVRRALVPIMLGACAVAGLGVLNREYALPAHSEFLQRSHDDVGGKMELDVGAKIDSDGMLVRVGRVTRSGGILENVKLTMPDLSELAADKGVFEPGPNGERGLTLHGVKGPKLNVNEKVAKLDGGRAFVRTDLTFGEITRGQSWSLFASSRELLAELNRPQVGNAQEIRALIHSRFMQPAASVVLVLLGIPFVLGGDRTSWFWSLALSISLSAGYFVIDAVSLYAAGLGYVDPQLGAWTPMFLFGPIAASLLHRVQT